MRIVRCPSGSKSLIERQSSSSSSMRAGQRRARGPHVDDRAAGGEGAGVFDHGHAEVSALGEPAQERVAVDELLGLHEVTPRAERGARHDLAHERRGGGDEHAPGEPLRQVKQRREARHRRASIGRDLDVRRRLGRGEQQHLAAALLGGVAVLGGAEEERDVGWRDVRASSPSVVTARMGGIPGRWASDARSSPREPPPVRTRSHRRAEASARRRRRRSKSIPKEMGAAGSSASLTAGRAFYHPGRAGGGGVVGPRQKGGGLSTPGGGGASEAADGARAADASRGGDASGLGLVACRACAPDSRTQTPAAQAVGARGAGDASGHRAREAKGMGRARRNGMGRAKRKGMGRAKRKDMGCAKRKDMGCARRKGTGRAV